MKRVIEGKIYDTDKAEKLHEYQNVDDRGNFHFYEEALYRTKKGNYFIAAEGNAMSIYAEALGGGSWGSGAVIRPITRQEAATWLQHQEGSEILTRDPDFQDLLEEA